MNEPFRLEIVQNRNLSLLGVHIGMTKDVAIVMLKKFSPSLYGTGISVKSTDYNISYDLDKYGFVCGIHISICDNGMDEKEVSDFTRYHKKMVQSNFVFKYKKEDKKECEESISEYYSSGVLNIDFYVCKNVQTLSGRNSAMIVVRFALGRDLLNKPLEGKALTESLYSILNANNPPQKYKFKYQFKMKQNTIYVLVICVSFLLGMMMYAYSHRYQVVHNGRGIVDKWTGVVEEVKYKK